MKNFIVIIWLLHTPMLFSADAGAGAGAEARQPDIAPPTATAVIPQQAAPAPGPGATSLLTHNRLSTAHGAGVSVDPLNHYSLIPSPNHSNDGFLSSLFSWAGDGINFAKKHVIDPNRSPRVIILGAIRDNSFFDNYPKPVDQQKAIIDVFSDISEKAKKQETRIAQLLAVVNFAQQKSLPIASSLQGELIPYVANELRRCSELLNLLQASQPKGLSDRPADG